MTVTEMSRVTLVPLSQCPDPTRPDPYKNSSSIHHLPMDEESKRCPGCEETKPTSAFYRSKREADGLQSRCIPCRKRYNSENREQINARHQDYLRRTGRIGQDATLLCVRCNCGIGFLGDRAQGVLAAATYLTGRWMAADAAMFGGGC